MNRSVGLNVTSCRGPDPSGVPRSPRQHQKLALGVGGRAQRANKAPLIHCAKELSNYNKRLLLGGRWEIYRNLSQSRSRGSESSSPNSANVDTVCWHRSTPMFGTNTGRATSQTSWCCDPDDWPCSYGHPPAGHPACCVRWWLAVLLCRGCCAGIGFVAKKSASGQLRPCTIASGLSAGLPAPI
jgi:hypothetical protein